MSVATGVNNPKSVLRKPEAPAETKTTETKTTETKTAETKKAATAKKK